MSRLVVGNLDCEVEWAGGPALPAAVTRRLALLATTLRIFAQGDGDALWLPGVVDPAVIPDDDGAPRPRLVTGALPAADEIVAWGATSRLDASHPVATDAPRPIVTAEPTSWRAALAALAAQPPPTVAVARAVNDRRFALKVATALGVALPGTRVIDSVAALRQHLVDGGAAASPTSAWVAKAPHTAAGRDRVRRRGAELDDATATRLTRLLAIHGALVVEPWMDRTVDVSQGGVVLGADRAILLAPHRGLCDRAGVIRALAIDDGAALAPAARAQLATVAAAVATRLGAAGYRGPFVVDGFVHAGGFHPLGEINARLTFGLVARAWAEQRGGPIVLGLGGPPPPGATPLVREPDSAWLADYSPSSSPLASFSSPSLASR